MAGAGGANQRDPAARLGSRPADRCVDQIEGECNSLIARQPARSNAGRRPPPTGRTPGRHRSAWPGSIFAEDRFPRPTRPLITGQVRLVPLAVPPRGVQTPPKKETQRNPKGPSRRIRAGFRADARSTPNRSGQEINFKVLDRLSLYILDDGLHSRPATQRNHSADRWFEQPPAPALRTGHPAQSSNAIAAVAPSTHRDRSADP